MQPQKARFVIFHEYRTENEMEGGYTTIDDGALSVSSDQKLFLIRLPKDFNVEELNGKIIDLSDKNKKDTEIQTSSNRKYVLKKDHTSVHSIVRPVIRNSVDGSTGVGPAFSGTFNLSEKIDIMQVSSSESLPIRPAYVPVEQVDFLRVRSVPLGSTSHVDSNGAIVPGKAVGPAPVQSSPKKMSKREHEPEVVTTQAQTEEEKNKKHKKEKKEKKDKKDKSA